MAERPAGADRTNAAGVGEPSTDTAGSAGAAAGKSAAVTGADACVSETDGDGIYGQRPVQTAQGSSVQKNVPAAKKSSGSAILDRVLRENQDTDTREYNVEETVILDSMGLSMPKIEQSPYMEEVHQMMVTGYEVKMPEQRDFVMEGLALLDQHVG